jgi:hypothetical protein
MDGLGTLDLETYDVYRLFHEASKAGATSFPPNLVKTSIAEC